MRKVYSLNQKWKQISLSYDNITLYTKCVDNNSVFAYNYDEGDDNMPTSVINVRVDSELKKEAEILFNDLGLNMSTAITMFLRSSVINEGIPFKIKRRDPNEQTLAAFRDAIEGKNMVGPFKSVSELFEDLNA